MVQAASRESVGLALDAPAAPERPPGREEIMECSAKGHLAGMPPIPVIGFGSERRNLEFVALLDDQDDAELDQD